MHTSKAALIVALIGIGCGCARGQAAVEAGGLSSNSAMAGETVGAQANSDFSSAGGDFNASIFAQPTQQTSARSPQPNSNGGSLIAPSGPPPDQVNRKNFELRSGKDAGKVLFRSIPSGAEIFVNHLLVGRTPLLLLLAPGKYDVEMRGTRQETGTRDLGVMPKETETVEINLSQRYPSNVSIRW